MAKIKNSTVLKQCKRICDGIKGKRNFSAQDSATVAVRTVLEELGLTEELGDEYKEERAVVVEAIKILFTASKNFQNSYLASEDNGNLMPKVEATEEEKANEFA